MQSINKSFHQKQSTQTSDSATQKSSVNGDSKAWHELRNLASRMTFISIVAKKTNPLLITIIYWLPPNLFLGYALPSYAGNYILFDHSRLAAVPEKH